MILQRLNLTTLKRFKMTKLTFTEFNNKLYSWYNETRPCSGKPKPYLISRFYDDYLNGQDFNFLDEAEK